MNIPAERRQTKCREEPEMQEKEERGQVCKTILLIINIKIWWVLIKNNGTKRNNMHT